MTTHAQRRAQQRAIPVMIDEWLDRFGDESYDGREQSSGILVMPASGKWSVRSPAIRAAQLQVAARL